MGTATLKNIILAALAAMPLNLAFADSSSSMEAGVACSGEACMLQDQTAFAQPMLQKIATDAIPVSRQTASTGSSETPLSYKIGRVETNNEVTLKGVKGQDRAVGVIASPCLMVTNQHVVFGDDRNPNLNTDHSVTFYFGEGASAFKWNVKGTPIYSGKRTAEGGEDFAIVRLDHCPGKQVGWLKPVARTIDQLGAVRIDMAGVSPDDDSKGAIEVQRNCQVLGRTSMPGVFKHGCQNRDGLSSSAMMDAYGQFVGINVGILNSGTSGALTMEDVLSDPTAKALLDEDNQQYAAELRAKSIQLGAASSQGRSS